jgi:ribosome-associated protein
LTTLSPESLKTIVTTALEDLKGVDIISIPVGQLTSVADYFIICSGTSTRHAKSLAISVMSSAKSAGYSASLEGEREAEWILVDAGDVVTHIMLPATREFYDLESLWQIDED